jgi:hypothetical protein
MLDLQAYNWDFFQIKLSFFYNINKHFFFTKILFKSHYNQLIKIIIIILFY